MLNTIGLCYNGIGLYNINTYLCDEAMILLFTFCAISCPYEYAHKIWMGFKHFFLQTTNWINDEIELWHDMTLLDFNGLMATQPQKLPPRHSRHVSPDQVTWRQLISCTVKSNISSTKSQNLNVCRLVLQLSLPNPMKPGVKSRMKM